MPSISLLMLDAPLRSLPLMNCGLQNRSWSRLNSCGQEMLLKQLFLFACNLMSLLSLNSLNCRLALCLGSWAWSETLFYLLSRVFAAQKDFNTSSKKSVENGHKVNWCLCVLN